MKRRRRHARIMAWVMLIVTAPGLIGTPAMAATCTWDGDTSTAWATAGNWDTLPADSLVTDTANFNLVGPYQAAATPRNPTVAVARSVNGITIGASNGAMTITCTGPLSIGAGGIVITSGAGAVSIGAVKIGASQSWANNDDSLLTLSSTLTNVGDTAPYTLTLNGTGTGGVTFINVISNGGTTGTTTLIVNAPNSTTTLSNANTFTGGFTLTSGTVAIGNATALGGATGAVNLNGGTLRSTAATTGGDRIIANSPLAISGTVTLGDTVNSGKLTFSGATQSIAASSTITALSAVTFGTGLMVGGAVQFQGNGTVTLQSSSDIGSIPLTLGDGTTFSGNGVGGNISVNSQNALGTSAVTINYGGTLTESVLFTPSNIVTVNTGGTFGDTLGSGSTVFGSTAGTLIVSSMAILTSGNGGQFRITDNTFPTSGVLMVSNAKNVLYIGDNTQSQPYPTLTGTMVFSSISTAVQSGSVAIGAVTTKTGFQTIALNNVSPGRPINISGTTLNANLTIAGSGNTGLTGMVPSGAAGALGTLNGAYAVNVNMAPAGAVSFTSGAPQLTTLTVNSGTVIASTDLGQNAAQLNGGVIRLGSAISSGINVGSNGGALESDGTARTYSGNLTGSPTSSLVLRTVGGALTIAPASGDNTGLNTGITLANAGTPATVFFTGGASLPNSSSNVTVPAGIAFGGTAVNENNYANRARFVTTTDSIYDVSNNNATPDLSAAGLDKDVWIGLSGTPITAYTLPSSGDNTVNYRIAPVKGDTVFQVANANVFNGARNLIVASGVVPSDAASSATNVLVSRVTFDTASPQNYTGTTTVSGTVKNALMGGGVVGPQIDVWNTVNGTTQISLVRGGYLRLLGAAGAMTGATAIGLDYGTLQVGNTDVDNANRLSDSAVITLSGGSLVTYGKTAGNIEDVLSLTVDKGFSTITPSANIKLNFLGAAGSVYTRTAGGVVNFAAAAPNVSFSSAPTGSSTSIGADGEANGRILIGAVLNAALNNARLVQASTGGPLVEPAYQFSGGVNLALLGTANYQGNIKFDTNPAATKVGNGDTGTPVTRQINSLYFAGYGSSSSFGIESDDTLDVTSGMILVSSVDSQLGTITGGKLTTSNSHGLTVLNYQNNGNILTISSDITGNPTLTWVASKSTITGNNNLGDIHLYMFSGHALNLASAGAIGGTGANIYLMGDGGISASADITTARNLIVGPQGGLYSDSGTARTTTISGAVTLNGNLTVAGAGDKTLGGAIGTALGVAGGGQGTITAQTNAGRLTLSGNNQYWTGGLRVGDGMQVRFNHANAAGDSTAPIVNHSGIGIIEFTSNFGTSLANNIVGSASTSKTLISNAKTSGATVTLSGKIYSVGGLTFQGYDDGSANETVVSGNVSLSGAPDIYSYGDATTQQRFVNAQGGINLGVTGYQTATVLTYGTAGFLAVPGGTTTGVTKGAEGYVRFDGVNSFIPGAVGPGYLAALRKGGATAGSFGYLLTGTGGGTTYTLPEGKSFVIGTLGAGAAQTGTFGAKGSGTATFLGSPKAAAGQLLAGVPGGDINIHANAATDAATLNLLADTGTTLVLGSGTAAENVVFTPTWGDSGATSAITLMRNRTGNTTLNKVGDGTLLWNGAVFTDVNGSAVAAGKVTLNVNAGALGGTGTIGGNVVFEGVSTLKVDADDAPGYLKVTGTVTLNDSPKIEIVGTLTASSYTLLTAASISGTFDADTVPSGYCIEYTSTEVKLGKLSGTVILFR